MLLRVPLLSGKKEKVVLKEKEKERSFFVIVSSLKMLSNVSIRLRVSPRVVKMIMSFPPWCLFVPGSSFENPFFSEPEWQDPEFFKEGSRIGAYASCTQVTGGCWWLCVDFRLLCC